MSAYILHGCAVSLKELALICGISEEAMDRRLLASASVEDAVGFPAGQSALKTIAVKLNIRITTLYARVHRQGLPIREAVKAQRRERNRSLIGWESGNLTARRCVGGSGMTEGWECDCRCGGSIVANRRALTQRVIRSCGCRHGRRVMIDGQLLTLKEAAAAAGISNAAMCYRVKANWASESLLKPADYKHGAKSVTT